MDLTKIQERAKTEKLINDSLHSMKEKLVIELQSREKNNSSTSSATGCNTSNTGSTSKAGSGSPCNTSTSHSVSNTGSSIGTSNTGSSSTNLSINDSGSNTTVNLNSCTMLKDEDIIEVIDLETANNESAGKKKPWYVGTISHYHNYVKSLQIWKSITVKKC